MANERRAKSGSRSTAGDKPAAVGKSDIALFLDAVRDATPIRAPRRVLREDKPPPVPVHTLLDNHAAIADSVHGPIPWDASMETGEELVFLRDTLPKDVLRKLRRGHWVVQDSIDLHGLNRDQARALEDRGTRDLQPGRSVRAALDSPEPASRGISDPRSHQ